MSNFIFRQNWQVFKKYHVIHPPQNVNLQSGLTSLDQGVHCRWLLHMSYTIAKMCPQKHPSQISVFNKALKIEVCTISLLVKEEIPLANCRYDSAACVWAPSWEGILSSVSKLLLSEFWILTAMAGCDTSEQGRRLKYPPKASLCSGKYEEVGAGSRGWN